MNEIKRTPVDRIPTVMDEKSYGERVHTGYLLYEFRPHRLFIRTLTNYWVTNRAIEDFVIII